MGSVPSVSAASAGEAMTGTTAVTRPSPPTQPGHLVFQGMAEGNMNDLNCFIDPCIATASNDAVASASASTIAPVDPIRREAALQVDKMERERLRILQDVAASMTLGSSNNSNSSTRGDSHLPFCVATEDGTLTDLVVLDGPLSNTPEDTTDPIRICSSSSSTSHTRTSFVSPPSQSRIHDHDHHQPYQATFDDLGALFFDLDTYESCFQSEREYETALEHETERRAALEHDKMKRKEQSILQHAASVSSSSAGTP